MEKKGKRGKKCRALARHSNDEQTLKVIDLTLFLNIGHHGVTMSNMVAVKDLNVIWGVGGPC